MRQPLTVQTTPQLRARFVQTSDVVGVDRGARVDEDAAVRVMDRDRFVDCPNPCEGGSQARPRPRRCRIHEERHSRARRVLPAQLRSRRTQRCRLRPGSSAEGWRADESYTVIRRARARRDGWVAPSVLRGDWSGAGAALAWRRRRGGMDQGVAPGGEEGVWRGALGDSVQCPWVRLERRAARPRAGRAQRNGYRSRLD
jgi:hypothetical protein